MRRIFCTVSTTLLVLSLLGFAAPSALYAGQDEHETPSAGHDDVGEAAEDHAAEVEHESAEPSILSGNPGNIFFTLLIFLSVVFILGRFAWKPLLAALQKREDLIRSSIEDAKRERKEADKLLAKYREQIDHAREEATAIIEKGKRDAEDVRRRIHEDARNESDEMIARARREIELASQNAIKELYDHTAELAVLAAGRVVSKTLSVDDHRDLVKESLDRMKSEGPSLN